MDTSDPVDGAAVGKNKEDDDDAHENSPESAGLARGLARSAVPKGAGRVAVGRLPLNSGQVARSSRVATKARMAKIQRVAKVSDRASTGLDFVEATQDAAESSSSIQKESWKTRTSNLAGNLVKNTILGMAVFATYEEAIDRFEGADDDNDQRQDLELMDLKTTYSGERPVSSTRLSQHFAAGFCAGSVHAGLGSVIESFVGLVWQPLHHRFLSKGAAPVAASNAAKTNFFPNLLQHSVSHAVLFGSYETLKRMTMLALTNTNTTRQVDSKSSMIEEETEGFIDNQLVAVGLAGGTAGMLQQVANDITEQTTKALQQKRSGVVHGKEQQHMGNLLLESIRPPRYSARSLLMLSIPTSIGFVAFEYGREAVMGE